MNIEEFKINISYFYSQIAESVIEEMKLEEMGREIIGEHFLLLRDGIDTVSFILTGLNLSFGYSYTCVYSDFIKIE